jgi:hypothetical protein
MANETDLLDDAFARGLLGQVRTEPWTGPKVFPNPDGDCIEVLLSNQSYCAERLDSLVTVYVNRDNGELVGALVKGIRSFVRKMVERYPGFKIEIINGRVRLEYLFTAGLWSHDSPENQVQVQRYKKLREVAEEAKLEVDLEAEYA